MRKVAPTLKNKSQPAQHTPPINTAKYAEPDRGVVWIDTTKAFIKRAIEAGKHPFLFEMGPFTLTPSAFSRHWPAIGLSCSEQTFTQAIWRFWQEPYTKHVVFVAWNRQPALQEIAQQMGITKRSVMRAAHTLQEKGLLIRTQGCYDFTPILLRLAALPSMEEGDRTFLDAILTVLAEQETANAEGERDG